MSISTFGGVSGQGLLGGYAIGGVTGSSFGDMVERTYRHLMSNQREVVAKLNPAYVQGTGQMTLISPGVNTIGPGSLLAVEWSVYRVDQWTPNPSSTGGTAAVTVVQGSTDLVHPVNSDVYVNPKYTRWDIAVSINDALNSLSSPSNGLFAVGTTTITYNPVFMGYDLAAVPANFNGVIELTYDIAPPSHNFPTIRRFKIVRGISNAKFPSGRGIILYESAWPGLNINFTYSYPFAPLLNPNDDAVVVSGLPATAIDIPGMQAEVDLTIAREIKRNFIEAQPDPRKAQDVVSGGMLNATNKLEMRLEQRISEEADRLAIMWPSRRPV